MVKEIRRPHIGAMLLTLLLGACSEGVRNPVDLTEPVDADAAQTVIGLDVSSMDAASGDTIALGIVIGEGGATLGVLQGRVRFDPTRLRYLGQAPVDGTLALANANSATTGEIRVLSFRVDGLEAVSAALSFEVVDPGYLTDLSYEPELAATPESELVEITATRPITRTEALDDLGPPHRDWSDLELIEIAGLMVPSISDGPLRVMPTATSIGDCNRDTAVDALDLVAVARIAVGLDAAPSDPNEFRVCDVNDSDDMDVLDVLDVSRFAVGMSTIFAPVGLRYRPMASGSEHACALDSDGTAWCWGYNDYGRLGDGTTDPGLDPTLVSGGLTLLDLAGGDWHTCGLDEGGQAYCWGANNVGQLGDGGSSDSSVPVAVTGSHTFAALSSAAWDHVCGIDTSAAAWCWGEGVDGQLGDGSSASQSSPVAVAGGISFLDLAAGYDRTCGIDFSGQAYCWGGPFPDTPTTVGVGQTFVEIVAGLDHNCAIDDVGDAYCWGFNDFGPLGDGTTTDSPTTPVAVAGGLTFDRLAAGWEHTCGLTAAGLAYCWGSAADGVLGDGTEGVDVCSGDPCRLSPVAVVGSLVFTTIDGGGSHTCAVDDAGEVWCWGSNVRGQLGFGSGDVEAPAYGPSQTVSGPAFVDVRSGSSHTCGLDGSDQIQCWGRNHEGQLGDGGLDDANAPVAVTGGPSAYSHFSLGNSHTCALDTFGDAYCWGDNFRGQLGDASEVGSTSPVAVVGSYTFTSISAGGFHSCGIDLSGDALCWGNIVFGQLGDGTTVGLACSGDCETSPVVVSGGLSFVQIEAGSNSSCGLTGTGAAYCWGHNAWGSVGDGTFVNRSAPVAVAGGLTFDEIFLDAAGSHACGLTAAGAAHCWGHNAYGELGDGTTTHAGSPVAVGGGHTFVTLELGATHTCGIDDLDEMLCWGLNDFGELGDGTLDSALLPTAVVGGPTFDYISAGGEFTCGVTSSGIVYCWGNNDYGQLGTGEWTRSLVPGLVVPFS